MASDPFAGKPFVNAAPGVDAARKPLGSNRLPPPPKASYGRGAALSRLAVSLSRLPNNARLSGGRNLFLP